MVVATITVNNTDGNGGGDAKVITTTMATPTTMTAHNTDGNGGGVAMVITTTMASSDDGDGD